MIDLSLIISDKIKDVFWPVDASLDASFKNVLAVLENQDYPINDREREDLYVVYAFGYIGGLLFIDSMVKRRDINIGKNISKSFGYCAARIRDIAHQRLEEKESPSYVKPDDRDMMQRFLGLARMTEDITEDEWKDARPMLQRLAKEALEKYKDERK